jgi:hypothetical protein
MIKDQEKWGKMVQITSALGGAKILAGIILLLIMPDTSACPDIDVGSMYVYPCLCIFLGVAWIGRGKRIQQFQASQASGLLPTHADAPVVQAYSVEQQPTK